MRLPNLIFILVFGYFSFVVTTGEAASPSVESVSPGIGQAGAEFPLRLVGAGLADAATDDDLILDTRHRACVGQGPDADQRSAEDFLL